MKTTLHVEPLLLSIAEVAIMTGISKRNILRMEKTGHIPSSIRVGRGSKRWRKSDIEKWIADGCPCRCRDQQLA
jgi:excisionase family DNA binding protein